MAVEGTIAAAAVSGFVAAFPKVFVELIKPVLPAVVVDTLHENKINSCTKKPEPERAEAPPPLDEQPEPPAPPHEQSEPPAPSFKQMGPATMMRVTSDENYIDIDWREYEVAEKAMKRVRENLHNENSYEKIANTCAKLIELYAMKSSRKAELIHIRDTIMKVDPTLAEKIEIDRFSQCAFYEGRIMLYR